MVKSKLDKYNACFIIDCHSFNENINYVSMEGAPQVCIGVDTFHTPNKIKDDAVKIFESYGYTVGINAPFGGSIVPL